MKHLVLLLTLALLVTVLVTAVSCGDSDKTTTAATTTAATAPTTTPVVTTPAVTTPAVTTPAVTTPAVTTPAVTTPVVTTPAVTTPAVTTPAATTPAETTPAVTTPAETTPATTAPTETTAPITTAANISTGKPDPIMTPVSNIINPQVALKKETFKASNGLDLPYRIFVPKDYSEEYAYPVVVVLHGAGERGNNNTSQLGNLVPNLFKSKDSPFYHAIVIFPQCPTNEQWVNTPWANGNYILNNVPISQPLAATVELLDHILETYSVNPNRQYVTGLSMGGFGTWDLLMRYPDRFAAGIPYCGGADRTQAAKLVNVPIWTFHDTTDGVVPCSGTQMMVKAIKNAGGTLIKYTETSQYGHDVWTPGSLTEGLFEWLFSQRKDAVK